MEARDYDRLEDMLCKELKKIVDKGEITTSSLDVVDKLTHSIKNVYKIQMGYEGEYSGADGRGSYIMRGDYSRGRYSRDGGYSGARGRYSRGYDDGDSYESYAQDREGTHYVGGYYSRDDGMVQDKIMEMMNQPGMTADQKRTLERALDVMRK